MPWLGDKLRLIALARTVKLLAVCLGAGLPASETFRAAARATGDPQLARACHDVADRVDRGTATLTDAMARHRAAFPDWLRQVVDTAEEAGTLDTSLARSADEVEFDALVALGFFFGLVRWGVLLSALGMVAYQIVSQFMHQMQQIAPLLE
jgi:type II secretory pathway component PulF